MEYDSEGKPCRACSDFKSFMRKSTAEAGRKKPVTRHNCPPDSNEIGQGSWTLLHTVSVYLPESQLTDQQRSDAAGLMSILARNYPCAHCAEDLQKDLVQDPPKVATGQEFAHWLCQLHNKTNVKLGKPVFDCSKVYERWRDGKCD